jgi:hypothetical protein
MPEQFELERAVVSRLLRGDYEYIPHLDAKDFTDGFFADIFHALQSGARDLIKIAKLTRRKYADVVPLLQSEALSSLMPIYIGALKEASAKRILRERIGAWWRNPETDTNAIRRDLDELEENSSIPEWTPLRDEISGLIDEAANAPDGCRVFKVFPTINKKLGPLFPGNVFTIAGRTGSGKTAFGLQIAREAAKEGKVLYMSLEMRERELAARVASAISGENARNVFRGKISNPDGIKNASQQESLFISTAGRNVSDLRRLIVGLRPAVVVVDSINLMKSQGESERIRLTNVTRDIKSIALEYSISVLMLVCARLRHVAGSQWGAKKCLNMKHLVYMQAESSVSGETA